MNSDPKDSWFSFLSSIEANRTEHALNELSSATWCRRLTRSFDLKNLTRDFYEPAKRPLMFEVRFAYEIQLAGIAADYECALGQGGSTVDFRLRGEPEWRMELWSAGVTVSLQESTEVHDHGGILTAAETPDASEEIRRVQTKIIAKVYDSEKDCPIKFPKPDGAVHVILADMRRYLSHGGDEWDYREIAFGRGGVRGTPWGSTVAGPLIGLFEPGHPNPGAAALQERVHYLGFVVEKKFVDGEILQKAIFCTNNRLLKSIDEAGDLFRTCPLVFSRQPFVFPSQ